MGLGVEKSMRTQRTAAGLGFAIRTVCASVGLGLIALAPTPLVAAPEGLLRAAGPAPSDAIVQAALLKHLQRADRTLDSRKPFRILSGPTLATGNTFGGGMEQAWLMCIIINAEKIEPGPRGIEGKALYLQRSRAGELIVVPIENWKDSSPQC